MTEAQGVLLLTAMADLQETIRIALYFLAGVSLAGIWATVWRG